MATKSPSLARHRVVSAKAWTAARKRLLAREKKLTHARERLAAERRALPWVRVEKDYLFDGPKGRETLGDLFEGRSQLVIYHFMFDPRWSEGCAHCSFWADNFEPAIIHMNQCDVTMIAVSRAPMAKLKRFGKRMGWGFKWVSSYGSDFNYDFGVSFTKEQLSKGTATYNYRKGWAPGPEMPGVSVFYKDPKGAVFHTYSSYGRGIDTVNTTYQYLDLVPKGRDEEVKGPQWFVDYHDRYTK
jgi:predicted dithiol-disulfide oxidoreductase (DUF899 family)